jgi:outer membrane protein assembly factor BamE (lipoprotein component of BamABCDE complex)
MVDQKFGTAVRISVLTLAAGVLLACSPQIRSHGYVPNEDSLSSIVVGKDNRESIFATLGSPTSAALMRDDGWYYIASRVKHETYHAPEEIDRQIVAISFDQRGIVSNIERYGLQDGQVVVLTRRITDNPIKGPGFIQQLIGSLGNFNLSDAL